MNLPLNVNEVKILQIDVEVKESIRQTKDNSKRTKTYRGYFIDHCLPSDDAKTLSSQCS